MNRTHSGTARCPRLALAAAVAALAPLTAPAEPYVGVSIGNAGVELGNLDDDDSAHKLIIGYIFDLPAVDLSFEASYIDGCGR